MPTVCFLLSSLFLFPGSEQYIILSCSTSKLGTQYPPSSFHRLNNFWKPLVGNSHGMWKCDMTNSVTNCRKSVSCYSQLKMGQLLMTWLTHLLWQHTVTWLPDPCFLTLFPGWLCDGEDCEAQYSALLMLPSIDRDKRDFYDKIH